MSTQNLARQIENLANVNVVPNTTNVLELNVPLTVDRAVVCATTLDVKGAATLEGAVGITGALTPTGGVVKGSRTKKVGGKVRAGAGAGWTFTASDTGSIANVAASQTAGTLIAFIEGLEVGDIITGFNVTASINSGGGTVTLDCSLRSLTVAAAATGTDASIASMTQVSVTAATASSSSKTGLSTTVAAGVSYCLLLTATTGSGCTIQLNSLEVIYTPNPAQ